MRSGPIVIMAWQGKNVVKICRGTLVIGFSSYADMLGTTNPSASPPGTIRGDYATVHLYLLQY